MAKVLCVGDAMIGPDRFVAACRELFPETQPAGAQWLGQDKAALQLERLKVEKGGPAAVPVPAFDFAELKDCEMLLVHYCPVSSELIGLLPKLRIVGVARGGVENIDVEGATAKGILVFRVEGRNAQAVSDFAIGLIIAELRNIARSHLALREGRWRKEYVNSGYSCQLQGKQIGIVGLGKIGSLVAKKLRGFEVKTVGYDPFVDASCFQESGVRKVELPELMSASDVVTIHARLSAATRHLIGHPEIQTMKPTAILVNTARAGLVDEAALAEALQTRQIGGAALDVFDQEPLPPNHPYLSLDNVTLTSHLAGTAVEVLQRSPYLLCEGIQDHLSHRKAATLVNPEALAKHTEGGE
jgi:D-3-phosphoglycerate dehydrogenase